MHKCLTRNAIHSAQSLLSCGVRLSVCLSLWCIETAKLTIKLFHRLVAPSF